MFHKLLLHRCQSSVHCVYAHFCSFDMNNLIFWFVLQMKREKRWDEVLFISQVFYLLKYPFSHAYWIYKPLLWYSPLPWHTHAMISVTRPTPTPEVERVNTALFTNHSCYDCQKLLTALSPYLLNVIWLQGQLLCKVTLFRTFIESFRV